MLFVSAYLPTGKFLSSTLQKIKNSIDEDRQLRQCKYLLDADTETTPAEYHELMSLPVKIREERRTK